MAITRFILEEELKQFLASIVSSPPVGTRKIVNIYVNETGKLVIQYED